MLKQLKLLLFPDIFRAHFKVVTILANFAGKFTSDIDCQMFFIAIFFLGKFYTMYENLIGKSATYGASFHLVNDQWPSIPSIPRCYNALQCTATSIHRWFFSNSSITRFLKIGRFVTRFDYIGGVAGRNHNQHW